MGKESGICLVEGGEGTGPNRPIDGDNRWKVMGEVGHAGRREIGQGDGEALSRSSELGDTS